MLGSQRLSSCQFFARSSRSDQKPTARPAAYAAGLAVGFWSDLDDLRKNWQEDQRWEPKMDADERDRQIRLWKKAVTKTFDWVDDDVSHG